MVTVIVIPGWAADQPSDADIDLAGYLEDRIAQLVNVAIVTPAGILTTMPLDANGRMSPVPAGTTVTTGNVRLTDWQTIAPGTLLNSEDTVALTVLYLKDAAGVFP
jgi:hypothetical protein